MRVEYSPKYIEERAKEFDKAYGYVNASIDGMRARYFVLPQSYSPRWRNFVKSYIARDPETKEVVSSFFAVADSIPRHLRDYWVFHEMVKQLRLDPDGEGRGIKAESIVLDVIPDELAYEYVVGRLDYFQGLSIRSWRSPSNFTREDFVNAVEMRDFLTSISPQDAQDEASTIVMGREIKKRARASLAPLKSK